MTDFTLSKHAATRAVDMGLDADFIRDLMLFPDVTRVSPVRGGGYTFRVKDDINAVCAIEDGVPHIVTFLPNTAEKWMEFDERPIPGRRFREEEW